MKTSMKTNMEILITTPKERGTISRVTSAIAEANVMINAICGYKVDDVAHLRIITDNNEKALTALENAGFSARENEVIVCEVEPHTLHPEMANLAGGYEVENNYWCASAHSGEHALLVFSPKDNLKGAALR